MRAAALLTGLGLGCGPAAPVRGGGLGGGLGGGPGPGQSAGCDAPFGPYFPESGGPDWDSPAGVAEPVRGAGVAVADFDQDGHLDVFLPNRTACQLLLGDGAFGFTDVSSTHLPGGPTDCGAWGATAADLDGDGDLDLLLPGWAAPSQVWENTGGGVFRDRSRGAGLGDAPVYARSASVADLEGDGDLDVFIATHVQRDDIAVGWPNQLLLQSAPFRFTDGGGLLPREARDSVTFVGSWVDLDDDLDLDLLLINDFGPTVQPNLALENRSTAGAPALVRVPGSAGLDLSIFGMGVGIADLNDDLIPDFAISDIDRLHLLQSAGAGSWVDVALAVGLRPDVGGGQRASWAMELVDVDNDGLLDVVAPFGPTEPFDDEPEEGAVPDQPDGLWLQAGDGQFRDHAPGLQVDHLLNGRGMAVVDLDGDGWLDLIKRDYLGAEAALLRASPGCGAWIELELQGAPPATMALGARVVVEAGGRRHTRWNLPGSTGLAGSGPSRVHIGLGDVDVVDRIEVRWPTGELEVREGVAARQRLVLREGG